MPLKLLLTKRLRTIKNKFSNKHITILKIVVTDIYFNILFFEPDTKPTGHKHRLSAQHRLIITDTERFVTALVVRPQSYRHLFASLQHFAQDYITDSFLT